MINKLPYMLGVWCGSLIDIAQLANGFGIADQVIQIIPDQNPRGYWVFFRVTGDQSKTIREHGARQLPRWSFLP